MQNKGIISIFFCNFVTWRSGDRSLFEAEKLHPNKTKKRK
ncbi:hypothetical protein HMPREF0653_02260 [Prevotella disiens JCM 6334 = ATCC 29426]|uniref:Uncharacterized protein n=2 Tax=Prevotella disiens TaxID=28130 RepID=E1KUE5_9BACT|nr:hypothetical protein HMPREF9296_0018 [Prevotella disiens FB035-09AN]ERJ73053.1 hypothetical protein HMPREF0653_02260 [Prevotella disiens JCM 6334 = ATCC 29426]